MAKTQETMTFTNFCFDLDTNEIVEYNKDGDETGRFAIGDVLKKWQDKFGLTMTIKQQSDFDCLATGGDKG